MERAPEALWQAFAALKRDMPQMRIRDAARQLAISEAELVAADPDAVALKADWPTLLMAMRTLGPVMALTRNEACVHEKIGLYDNISINGNMGLALNPEIDLRLFLSHWKYVFAVEHRQTDDKVQRSIQVFDRYGEAIHKIFLTPQSDVSAFNSVKQDLQTTLLPLVIDTVPASSVELPDDAIDVVGLRAGWLALKDVHDFHGLLTQHKVSRQQAFRLAPEGHAWTVAKDAIEPLLHRASETETPIMVFAGNRGCIQIHTGPVHRVERLGPWLNVLDPNFNLHLRTDLIQEAWVVKKPGDCGMLTSLELFDAHGQSIVTLFGERKPGKPELASWVKLVSELAVEDGDVA